MALLSMTMRQRGPYVTGGYPNRGNLKRHSFIALHRLETVYVS